MAFRGLIVDGVSAKTRRMRKQIDDAVRDNTATVLITGPTGVGKELVAREIHERSRAPRPYVPVNLNERSDNLIQSALFGHERGAFTGADERHTGYLDEAAKGTLFLDELGELAMSMQAILLRVVEQRSFRPMGGKRDQPVEARFLAATNRDLRTESQSGRFRLDLYFRLAQYEVHIPSLDERREDILAITRSIAPSLELTEAAARWLENRPWPGNVRELEVILRRVSGRCEAEKSRRVDVDLLRDICGDGESTDKAREIAEHAFRLGATAADFEDGRRALFDLHLDKSDGNVSAAARALDIPRSTFRRGSTAPNPRRPSCSTTGRLSDVTT